MKSKNKILDSFEQFIAARVSILKNRIIQITGFKSDFITSKSIDIDVDNDTITVNCINNEGAYNLLSSVVYKRNQLLKNKGKEKHENQTSEVSFEFA